MAAGLIQLTSIVSGIAYPAAPSKGVNWQGAKVNSERYWKGKIGFSKPKLLHIENILRFVHWGG